MLVLLLLGVSGGKCGHGRGPPQLLLLWGIDIKARKTPSDTPGAPVEGGLIISVTAAVGGLGLRP